MQHDIEQTSGGSEDARVSTGATQPSMSASTASTARRLMILFCRGVIIEEEAWYPPLLLNVKGLYPDRR